MLYDYCQSKRVTSVISSSQDMDIQWEWDWTAGLVLTTGVQTRVCAISDMRCGASCSPDIVCGSKECWWEMALVPGVGRCDKLAFGENEWKPRRDCVKIKCSSLQSSFRVLLAI